jgi:uncharacterized protein with GYD domain
MFVDGEVMREEIAMHFCITALYTAQALNSIMDDPKTNRYEAVKKLVEAGGGKLLSMYSTAAEGPGVLMIVDVPDPAVAPLPIIRFAFFAPTPIGFGFSDCAAVSQNLNI